MGWASGSGLMSEVIASIQENVDDHSVRVAIYTDLINAFEAEDWDTQDECMGEDDAFDEAMNDLHPEWDDDGREAE